MLRPRGRAQAHGLLVLRIVHFLQRWVPRRVVREVISHAVDYVFDHLSYRLPARIFEPMSLDQQLNLAVVTDTSADKVFNLKFSHVVLC